MKTSVEWGGECAPAMISVSGRTSGVIAIATTAASLEAVGQGQRGDRRTFAWCSQADWTLAQLPVLTARRGPVGWIYRLKCSVSSKLL